MKEKFTLILDYLVNRLSNNRAQKFKSLGLPGGCVEVSI